MKKLLVVLLAILLLTGCQQRKSAPEAIPTQVEVQVQEFITDSALSGYAHGVVQSYVVERDSMLADSSFLCRVTVLLSSDVAMPISSMGQQPTLQLLSRGRLIHSLQLSEGGADLLPFLQGRQGSRLRLTFTGKMSVQMWRELPQVNTFRLMGLDIALQESKFSDSVQVQIDSLALLIRQAEKLRNDAGSERFMMAYNRAGEKLRNLNSLRIQGRTEGKQSARIEQLQEQYRYMLDVLR